jgi:hypothetical protein
MTVVYRVWWPLLDLDRLLIRVGVERWRSSLIWPIGMALRLTLHHLVGSPWLIAALAFVAWQPSQVTALVAVVAAGGVEAGLRVGERWSRFASAVMSWRRGLAVRRRFPRLWADYAGRTKRVQAETGKEPSTPVRWRPLVDHPRISWWSAIDVDQRSAGYVVGPPPDRTFAELAVALPALAARLPWVYSIELDFESERSSFGDLRFYFADPLAQPKASEWNEADVDQAEEVDRW